MKKLFVFALVMVVLSLSFSCEKYKQRKELKSIFGTYNLSSHTSYEILNLTGYDTVIVNDFTISESGLVMHNTNVENMPSANFQISESTNSNYDYQLYFTKIVFFYFDISSNQMISINSPSSEELNENRSFYLKVIGDDEIRFVVVENQVDNLIFLK